VLVMLVLVLAPALAAASAVHGALHAAAAGHAIDVEHDGGVGVPDDERDASQDLLHFLLHGYCCAHVTAVAASVPTAVVVPREAAPVTALAVARDDATPTRLMRPPNRG
jgi:hypothetical protein